MVHLVPQPKNILMPHPLRLPAHFQILSKNSTWSNPAHHFSLNNLRSTRMTSSPSQPLKWIRTQQTLASLKPVVIENLGRRLTFSLRRFWDLLGQLSSRKDGKHSMERSTTSGSPSLKKKRQETTLSELSKCLPASTRSTRTVFSSWSGTPKRMPLLFSKIPLAKSQMSPIWEGCSKMRQFVSFGSDAMKRESLDTEILMSSKISSKIWALRSEDYSSITFKKLEMISCQFEKTQICVEKY